MMSDEVYQWGVPNPRIRFISWSETGKGHWLASFYPQFLDYWLLHPLALFRYYLISGFHKEYWVAINISWAACCFFSIFLIFLSLLTSPIFYSHWNFCFWIYSSCSGFFRLHRSRPRSCFVLPRSLFSSRSARTCGFFDRWILLPPGFSCRCWTFLLREVHKNLQPEQFLHSSEECHREFEAWGAYR